MKSEPEKRLSPRAKQLWDTLNKKTKMLVDKHYPVKRERNEAISALRNRGVTIDILTEITGLNKSTILYVARIQKKALLPFGELARSVAILKQDLESFYNSFLAILNQQMKRHSAQKARPERKEGDGFDK